MAVPPRACPHLGRARSAFDFPTADGVLRKCWWCALCHRPLLGRSLALALVVGTVLAAINHGDVLVSGQWSAAVARKVALTYCVPFAVAVWSALANSRVRTDAP